LAGIVLTGIRLRRVLTGMSGAIGVTLYFQVRRRRVGSISVWENKADLRRFVMHPEHVPVMHKYRSRGTVRGATWETDHFDLPDAWSEAKRGWNAAETSI
jgi:heme-degrading monooxygenase HmoA